MDYREAIKVVEANKHLLGKKMNGAVVDEIIIAPIDMVSWEDFESQYVQTNDAQTSILPYINSDLRVIAVFDKKLWDQGVFIYAPIDRLLKNFDVKYK